MKITKIKVAKWGTPKKKKIDAVGRFSFLFDLK
jgi:hypothetical protein